MNGFWGHCIAGMGNVGGTVEAGPCNGGTLQVLFSKLELKKIGHLSKY